MNAAIALLFFLELNKMPFFTSSKTHLGYSLLEFADDNENKCTMQKSSSALEEKIWLGIDDPKPQILHGDAALLGVETDAKSGWIDYPISPRVNITTRMHLTQRQALSLAKKLMDFAVNGDID